MQFRNNSALSPGINYGLAVVNSVAKDLHTQRRTR